MLIINESFGWIDINLLVVRVAGAGVGADLLQDEHVAAVLNFNNVQQTLTQLR